MLVAHSTASALFIFTILTTIAELANAQGKGPLPVCKVPVNPPKGGGGQKQQPALGDLDVLRRMYSPSANDHWVSYNAENYEKFGADGYEQEGALGLILLSESSDWCPEAKELNQFYTNDRREEDYYATSKFTEQSPPSGFRFVWSFGSCVPKKDACGATVPLYSLYSSRLRDHVLTSDKNERDTFKSQGYRDLGIDCYIWER